MVDVRPPDPSGGSIPFGPDPLGVLLRFLRLAPKGAVPALLTPLKSSSPFLWSVSVPGVRIPLVVSLPHDSLPARLLGESFSGTLFEDKQQLFFRGGQEDGVPSPVLILLGDLPSGDPSSAGKLVSDAADRIFDRSGQSSVQTASEPHFLKNGEVPNPLFQKIYGPVPPDVSFPGGVPPSVMFEICWPDRRDDGSHGQSGAASSASFSFRLSISYANGESLDLAGVFDPSSRRIKFFPRSSSPSLLSYWDEMGRDLGDALGKNFSILMDSHRRDHERS
ncbi:MAG: hypothetical protein ACYCXP_04700 [Leptospirillum sp.]